jgi:hypothetical protein
VFVVLGTAGYGKRGKSSFMDTAGELYDAFQRGLSKVHVRMAERCKPCAFYQVVLHRDYKPGLEQLAAYGIVCGICAPVQRPPGPGISRMPCS